MRGREVAKPSDFHAGAGAAPTASGSGIGSILPSTTTKKKIPTARATAPTPPTIPAAMPTLLDPLEPELADELDVGVCVEAVMVCVWPSVTPV